MLEHPWRWSSFGALVALRHPQLAGNAAGKSLRVPACRADNTDCIPEDFTELPNHALDRPYHSPEVPSIND